MERTTTPLPTSSGQRRGRVPCPRGGRGSVSESGRGLCRVALRGAVFGPLLLAAGLCGAQVPNAPGLGERTLLQQPEKIPALLKEQRIAPGQVPNPHWRTDACVACHRGDAAAGKSSLRAKDRNALCNSCHETVPAPRIEHPVGVVPSKEMSARMGRSRLNHLAADGTIDCTTCHDLLLQCQQEHLGARGINPRFLRGGPYRVRSGICFQCHEDEGFQRLNPHEQVSAKGGIKEQTCLVCHRGVPDVKAVRGAGEADLLGGSDPSLLCTGCHQIRLHPGGGFSARGAKLPNHYVKPSVQMAARMKQIGRREGVDLPLDPRGHIFCATCHDPHQEGVLPHAPSRAAGEEHRLRMKNICLGCHDK